MCKPYLYLEDLLEILPLCLSEDIEIKKLGEELLKTYDCCLFPLTTYLLYPGNFDRPPFPFLSSKSEEEFLGKTAIEAYDQKNYFAYGYNPREIYYKYWWFYPRILIKQRLELFK